jgi:hypothetical protein
MTRLINWGRRHRLDKTRWIPIRDVGKRGSRPPNPDRRRPRTDREWLRDEQGRSLSYRRRVKVTLPEVTMLENGDA